MEEVKLNSANHQKKKRNNKVIEQGQGGLKDKASATGDDGTDASSTVHTAVSPQGVTAGGDATPALSEALPKPPSGHELESNLDVRPKQPTPDSRVKTADELKSPTRRKVAECPSSEQHSPSQVASRVEQGSTVSHNFVRQVSEDEEENQHQQQNDGAQEQASNFSADSPQNEDVQHLELVQLVLSAYDLSIETIEDPKFQQLSRKVRCKLEPFKHLIPQPRESLENTDPQHHHSSLAGEVLENRTPVGPGRRIGKLDNVQVDGVCARTPPPAAATVFQDPEPSTSGEGACAPPAALELVVVSAEDEQLTTTYQPEEEGNDQLVVTVDNNPHKILVLERTRSNLENAKKNSDSVVALQYVSELIKSSKVFREALPELSKQVADIRNPLSHLSIYHPTNAKVKVFQPKPSSEKYIKFRLKFVQYEYSRDVLDFMLDILQKPLFLDGKQITPLDQNQVKEIANFDWGF